MKAIAYRTPGPADVLEDVTLTKPEARGFDLLVQVQAVAVNPVDIKVRSRDAPQAGQMKVLGWDAVGRVVAMGAEVAGFALGDEVYYAGAIGRVGANSEFHLIDCRIVGHKPKSLTTAQAAALPLTAITAWEAMFERMDIRCPVPGAAPAVLIIGGAGGVGSIAIQLARAISDVTVIATASRPETASWVRELGAHHVIDHTKPMARQIEALGIGSPSHVFSTNDSVAHAPEVQKLIAPQGHFCVIDDPMGLDILGFKNKSVSIHIEGMFTRTNFQTPDMDEQGKILNRLARLVDEGKIRTTLTKVLSPINAETLQWAHRQLETGKTMGKIVLEGF